MRVVWFDDRHPQEYSRMKAIRPFTKDDIPQTVDMFQRLLLGSEEGRRLLSSAELPEYFEQIFFHNPWYDEEIPSLVYQGTNGKIIGFLGVTPRPMLLRGRPIRMALSYHLMVEPEIGRASCREGGEQSGG